MTPQAPKIVVIGSTYIDMAIRTDRIPVSGQRLEGSAMSLNLAGHGPIQATQAARCDCQTHLISKVGGDPFGMLAKSALTEIGINTDYVYTAEPKNTGTIVTIVNSEGENATITYTGANSALQPLDIDMAEEAIEQACACIIDGQLPYDTIITAIRCAKVHNTKVIFNPSRQFGQNNSHKHDIEFYAGNVVIANFYEAANITDYAAANTKAAKLIGSDLMAMGVEAAVITMGKKGSMVVDRQGADHIPAFPIELVDHTGTGDAFIGALAADYCASKDIRSAVKFASAAGALACTNFGSIEAIPTKEKIIELLQDQDFKPQ